MPQIEVTFNIDVNGILTVHAKDLGTGKENKITVQNAGGLSKEEIEKMKSEAESHAAEDKKRREVIDLKNQADCAGLPDGEAAQGARRQGVGRRPRQYRGGAEQPQGSRQERGCATASRRRWRTSTRPPQAGRGDLQAGRRGQARLPAAAAAAGPQPAGAAAGAGGDGKKKDDDVIDAEYEVKK